jgi:hypothetical protein
MQSKHVVGGVVLAAVISVGGFFGYRAHSAVAPSNCVAGTDELCPTDFQLNELKEYRALEAKFVALNAKIQAQIHDDQVRMKGLEKDFSEGAPQGYNWDNKKMRWVKAPPAPVQTPAAPAK